VGRSQDMLHGTLDLLILQALSVRPMYGWSIAQRIRQVSGEVLEVNQGSLYPSLHRLEQRGWIEAEWETSESQRRVKVYALTAAGRRELARETEEWRRFRGAVERLLEPPPGGEEPA
jgi:PadR family transcriptional regulator, regulatory protein PadR